jgi:hypothetical protein
MTYNKDQWISSFEDAMVGLRPHMAARVHEAPGKPRAGCCV